MIKPLIPKKIMKKKVKKSCIKRKIRNALVGGSIVLASLLPMKNAYAQELIRNVHNPFVQPIETTKYYGSGDVNLDGDIDIKDYELIKNGTKNDYAEVNGDNLINNADASLLEKYLNKEIPYLPGHWNKLQTKEERIDWVKKMFAIDTTNEDYWGDPNYGCVPIENQVNMDFSGLENRNNIPSKYNKKNIARFNLPVYGVSRGPPGAHTFNGIVVGNNSLNVDDWLFVDDSHLEDIYVKVGEGTEFQSMPYDSEFYIYSLDSFIDEDHINGTKLAKFKYDYDVPKLVRQFNPQLVLIHPNQTLVENESSLEFELKPNYPNPFNNSTNIEYVLNKPEKVSLEVYDVLGRKIETLVDNEQMSAGKYSANFNAREKSSGTYFYKLKTGNNTETKKMMIVK